MEQRHDTVVVGGGIIGAAVLYELAKRGVPALLLERGRFGRESTGKSAAIVRMHYSNPEVVRMALRSRDLFRRFPEEIGGPAVFSPVGWLFLVPESDIENARRNVEMQRGEGLDVEELDLRRVAELIPGIRLEGIAGAWYEPASGFADPLAPVLGYIDAARELGAEAQEGRACLRIVRDQNGAVSGVETPEGAVWADRVVLAAGPWSGVVAAESGFELPIHCTREQELIVEPRPGKSLPCSISNVVDRFYARPAGGGDNERVLIGRGFPKPYEVVEPDGYDDALDDDFEAELRERVGDRLPQLAEAPRVASTVGLYAVTPDWHPLLGAMPDVEGLVLATGGSGHCFKLAPAIGELVAASMTGEELPYASTASFSLSRFAKGEAFASTYGGNRA